ncbi:long-chain fatty acid--CoA ligase [Myxococcota bacterium]|nr:long-chain fatty acid--CoA ligase [Myxococcota bacterium]
MLTSLDLLREDEEPNLPWLTASQADPASFWGSLFDHAARTGGQLKSRIGVAHDLYADAILRHRGGDRAALLVRDRVGGWRSHTYGELDQMAGACASAWLSRGVKPGAVVALVMDFRLELVVAMLAALRIGLTFSLVPPGGALLGSRRLAALKPDHVVLDPEAPSDPGAATASLLPIVLSGSSPGVPPPAFAPEQPVIASFSPVRAPLDRPVMVTAERALLSALRDGILAWRLSPRTTIVAPGLDVAQYQPALLLACFLAGATWVHIPIEVLEAHPRVFFERPARVWVMSTRVRDLLRSAGIAAPEAPTHWVRLVDEPFEWHAWRDAVRTLRLEAAPAATVLVDAADGGCVLFSARRPGSTTMRTLPSAAQAWRSVDFVDRDRDAIGGSGVFTPIRGREALWPGWFVLAKVGTEYSYGGPVRGRRAARVYPSSLVAEVAAADPAVHAAGVVAVPAGGTATKFVLCGFHGSGAPLSAKALAGRVTSQVGAEDAPDAIELFPLWPHRRGDAVDESWVRTQYLLGLLQRKSKHPVFQRLTALRTTLVGA